MQLAGGSWQELGSEAKCFSTVQAAVDSRAKPLFEFMKSAVEADDKEVLSCSSLF